MCIFPKAPKVPAAPILAAPQSDAMSRQSEIEEARRRRRAGAGADVLTSPMGLTGSGSGQTKTLMGS